MAQEIWTQVSPAVVNLAVMVILALITVLGARLQAWAVAQAQLVKAKTTKEQRDLALAIVDGVVNTVEQLYKNGHIKKPDKFDQAFARVWTALDDVGLEFSDEQIENMIEASVKMLTDIGTEFKKEFEEPD